MEIKKNVYLINYIGISESTAGFKYPPITIKTYSFLEAACKGVSQVEYAEPGNFKITKISLIDAE